MAKELRSFFLITGAAIGLLLVTGCTPKDYRGLPSLSEDNFFQCVIEIPAGSNLRVSYCPITHRFRAETVDGHEKKVPYLPSPLNYGFIPSTRVGSVDGSGEVLHSLVISERLDIGTVIEIIPVGLFIVKDDFHTDYNVLAIPARQEKQVVGAYTFKRLESEYPEMTDIIEAWFLNSKVYRNPVVLGWEDEHTAKNFIIKWMVD